MGLSWDNNIIQHSSSHLPSLEYEYFITTKIYILNYYATTIQRWWRSVKNTNFNENQYL